LTVDPGCDAAAGGKLHSKHPDEQDCRTECDRLLAAQVSRGREQCCALDDGAADDQPSEMTLSNARKTPLIGPDILPNRRPSPLHYRTASWDDSPASACEGHTELRRVMLAT
jgi:hypothetical protein